MKKIFNEVALELGLQEKEVRKAYNSVWFFIKHTISYMDIKNTDNEELNAMRTSFNLIRLGKLFRAKRKKEWVFSKYNKT